MIIEHMEFDFITSRLFHKKTLRFLDVGAHTGEFLTIFRKSNHRHKYEVIAIEPLGKNLLRLRLKAATFFLMGWGKVRVLPIGIGDNGKTRFYLGDSSTLFTSNTEWTKRFPREFANFKEFEIQTRSFKFLQEQVPAMLTSAFDIVKIDTEGSDSHVLSDLSQSKILFDSLIIEFDGNSFLGIKSQLTEMGLTEIYAFVRNGIHTIYIGHVENDLALTSTIANDGNMSGNLVAFRPNKVSR